MKIDAHLTDQAILEEIGGRLARVRVDLDLTQAALAEKAGVGKRTIERLESGEAATQLSGFVRVCRALGLLERFEALLPEPVPSPMAQIRKLGRQRQRATGKKKTAVQTKTWSWGDSQ